VAFLSSSRGVDGVHYWPCVPSRGQASSWSQRLVSDGRPHGRTSYSDMRLVRTKGRLGRGSKAHHSADPRREAGTGVGCESPYWMPSSASHWLLSSSTLLLRAPAVFTQAPLSRGMSLPAYSMPRVSGAGRVASLARCASWTPGTRSGRRVGFTYQSFSPGRAGLS
jgi:hypothetical protein